MKTAKLIPAGIDRVILDYDGLSRVVNFDQRAIDTCQCDETRTLLVIRDTTFMVDWIDQQVYLLTRVGVVHEESMTIAAKADYKG